MQPLWHLHCQGALETPRVKGEGDTGQQNGLCGGLGVMLALPLLPSLHLQPATESPVLGAARPGSKSFLCLHWPPRKQPRARHCYRTHQPGLTRSSLPSALLMQLLSPVQLAGKSCLWGHHPGPSLTLLMLWQRLLSLEGEGCPKGVHIWLAVKAGEHWTALRYPAAQPGGGKVCLDPCWGEHWGWLQKEGHRQPALGLVCTMHEALGRWREEVPALLGCSI